jgi:hypothetical protein
MRYTLISFTLILITFLSLGQKRNQIKKIILVDTFYCFNLGNSHGVTQCVFEISNSFEKDIESKRKLKSLIVENKALFDASDFYYSNDSTKIKKSGISLNSYSGYKICDSIFYCKAVLKIEIKRTILINKQRRNSKWTLKSNGVIAYNYPFFLNDDVCEYVEVISLLNISN